MTLNGEKVIHEAQLPGIPEEGPIGLQHHGSAIDFANIWIKEL
ncbi:MAG: family 16 glycoside hydrolase [Akkermansiaceae bacterium]